MNTVNYCIFPALKALKCTIHAIPVFTFPHTFKRNKAVLKWHTIRVCWCTLSSPRTCGRDCPSRTRSDPAGRSRQWSLARMRRRQDWRRGHRCHSLPHRRLYGNRSQLYFLLNFTRRLWLLTFALPSVALVTWHALTVKFCRASGDAGGVRMTPASQL